MLDLALNLFLASGNMWSWMASASFINPRTGYVESIATGPRTLKVEEMTLQLVCNAFGSESA
jgi:hypothetical protein